MTTTPPRQLSCHDFPSNSHSKNAALDRLNMPHFIVASAAMERIIEFLDTNHESRATILITGETGTGKELIARAAHALSARCRQEFNAFNCTAVGHEMIESQLFGHQRGSFTGAMSDSKGIIRATEGGTLLLDEIGELSLSAQPKLLRFLQSGEVHPVGAPRPMKTNVRIIAATNRNLGEEVNAGRFRADLFERLNVMRLHVPPLRERRKEIPLLINHFLSELQAVECRSGMSLNAAAIDLLTRHDWPRNVRELHNEIHRVVLQAKNNEGVGVEKLSSSIRETKKPSQPLPIGFADKILIDSDLPYHQAMEELQRALIIRKLNQHGGNISHTSHELQMDRTGLMKAMARLGIRH